MFALREKFAAAYEKDEPTVQLYKASEPNQQPEARIQKDMDNMYHLEAENREDGAQEN